MCQMRAGYAVDGTSLILARFREEAVRFPTTSVDYSSRCGIRIALQIPKTV